MRSKRFLAIALIIAMLLFSLQAAFGEDVSLEAATEIVNASEEELDAVVGDEATVEIEEGDILPEEDGGEIESVPVDSEEISIESGDELIVEDEEELPGAEEAAAEELDGADLLAVLEDGAELLEVQEDGGDSEETVELPDVAEYSEDELAPIQGVNIYIQDSTAE